MPKRYPQAKIDEALLAYYTQGSYTAASETTGIATSVIHEWVTDAHRDRYDELVQKHGPTLERQVVAKLARTSDKAVDRVDMALDAVEALILDGNLKDANLASGVAKNAALVLGIATDKKLTLEGRPTQITEHRDSDDILRSLKSMGIVVDATYEEIPTTQPHLTAPKQDTTPGAQRTETDRKRVEVQPA